MTEKKKILNLDDLFGTARAVKVKFADKEYELLRIEALGPKAISRFQKMQKRANQLQMINIENEISNAEEEEIISLFDEMLKMLCATLPVGSMPFAAKAKTLEFYVMETQGKNALDVTTAKGKKGKRTGVTSIRS